jgi:hypothetical protein
VVSDHDSSECLKRDGSLCSRWAVPDHRHWVLARPRMLTEPIPCRGLLKLSDPLLMLRTR